MSTIFWKNIHLCVQKFKCLPTNLSPPPVNDDDIQINNSLIKNFNSIYDTSVNSVSTGSKSVPFSSSAGEEYHHHHFNSNSSSSSVDDDHDDDDDKYNDINLDCFNNPPDFSSVFASQRFFFSSPGKSNSIIDDYSSPPEIIMPPSPAPAVENDTYCCKSASGGCGGGGTVVAVQIQTYSPDPYGDFRRSMQEMVEAHELKDLKKADWNYLHELLLCYLSLNPKHTHKLIIGAFTDLVVSLTLTSSNPDNYSGHRKTDRVGIDKHRCTTSRQPLS